MSSQKFYSFIILIGLYQVFPTIGWEVIQVTSFTRTYQTGSPHHSASTTMITAEAIEARIEKLHILEGDIGYWAMYGGEGKFCYLERIYGVGHKAIFNCPQSGTYYIFFTLRPLPLKLARTYTNRDPEKDTVLASDLQWFQVDPFVGLKSYERNLEQKFTERAPDNASFSDPVLILKREYCYQWAYRFEKINSVGFIFDEVDPTGTTGSYYLYNLFIWIVEPGGVSWDEIFGTQPPLIITDEYSQMLTRRYHDLGVNPCLRFAHEAIELISDAKFTETVQQGASEYKGAITPHWELQIKVYMDRMVSYIKDISFEITQRQHSALYGCFVSDVRVFVPARKFIFSSKYKQLANKLVLDYSDMSGLKVDLMRENLLYFFGHSAKHIGYPWELTGFTTKIFNAKVIANPCVSQELVLVYKGISYLSTDWLMKNELQRIVLPAMDEIDVIFKNDQDHMDRESFSGKDEELAIGRTNPGAMEVFDFAFTPTHIVALRKDSSVYLHPTNPALKGVGINTVTRKYRIGAIVKRTWCQKFSTPKSHNEVVPLFSKGGNIIILFPVPVEGPQRINEEALDSSCLPAKDNQEQSNSSETTTALTEAEIHKQEEVDIGLALKAKALRETLEKKQQTRKKLLDEAKKSSVNVEGMRSYWFAGEHRIGGSDPHYAKGATAPSNVKVGTNNTFFNVNNVYVIEKDFAIIRKSLSSSGLDFNINEVLTRDTRANNSTGGNGNSTSGDTLTHDAPNDHIFALHAVAFSAVEKLFLAAIEFRSKEFPRNDTGLTIFVSIINAVDFPSTISIGTTRTWEIYLHDVRFTFSGAIIQRDDIGKWSRASSQNTSDPDNSSDSNPLSKRISTMETINTAIPIYILRMGNLNVYASLDGSFARPIGYYYDFNPVKDENSSDMTVARVKPEYYIPEDADLDTIVTENGLISILMKRSTPDANNRTKPQEALIGSLLTNEPLRTIRQFLQNESYFQATTPEGEIVYGQVQTEGLDGQELLRNPPFTKFLSIPFWSLLHGRFSKSFGANAFNVDNPAPNSSNIAENVEVNFDEICPFASFTLEFIQLPYVEAGYRTRITAEIAYYGSSIPLEADLIIEFTEVQGLSIVISSNLEVTNDQTIILKTIDIETFMTDLDLRNQYQYSETRLDTDVIPEFTRVFTMTIRPSILNINCRMHNYFKNFQLNIGCVPLTKIRLIGEALPLRKITFQRYAGGNTSRQALKRFFARSSRRNRRTWIEAEDVLTFPRDEISFHQRELFDCEDRDSRVCKVPHARLIHDNFYDLLTVDTIIPKFEQFMTEHVRPLTGNVVMYDVLGSYTFDAENLEKNGVSYDKKKRPPTRLIVNTTQWQARCIIDDEDWYGALNKNNSRYMTSDEGKVSLSTGIYQHFVDCFSRTEIPGSRKKQEAKEIFDTDEPEKLAQRTYYVFNLTNRNSLKLPEKRNWIYIIRAVVLNTKYNSFSYCQKLETFFAFKVAGIARQRVPLPWLIYLIVTLLVLLLIFMTYFYFSRFYVWRVDIHHEKDVYEKSIVHFAERNQLPRQQFKVKNPFKRLVRKVMLLTRWKEMSRKDAQAKDANRPATAARAEAEAVEHRFRELKKGKPKKK